MSTRQILIGCLLTFSSMGVFAAAEVDTQDLATTQHATIDTASGHESAGGSSDMGSAPSCRNGCSANESTGSSNDPSGTGASAHPHASHRASLGWQSLLPGSIQ